MCMDILIFVSLCAICQFSLSALRFSVSDFQQFYYHEFCHDFFYVYPVCNLLSFLELWVLIFHSVWMIFNNMAKTAFFVPISFGLSYHVYFILLDFVTEVLFIISVHLIHFFFVFHFE
jgi:hypothetical protein